MELTFEKTALKDAPKAIKKIGSGRTSKYKDLIEAVMGLGKTQSIVLDVPKDYIGNNPEDEDSLHPSDFMKSISPAIRHGVKTRFEAKGMEPRPVSIRLTEGDTVTISWKKEKKEKE